MERQEINQIMRDLPKIDAKISELIAELYRLDQKREKRQRTLQKLLGLDKQEGEK